ncbi:MAG: pseudouridine synthase [Cyanobacteria bacterium J06649_4]
MAPIFSRFVCSVMNRSPSYYTTHFQTGKLWKLTRTVEAEHQAKELMQQLAATVEPFHTGKLFGILIAQNVAGDVLALKAYSGHSTGRRNLIEWVPPITHQACIALEEADTFHRLAEVKKTLIALEQSPQQKSYKQFSQRYAVQRKELTTLHKNRKAERDRKRTQYVQHLHGSELTDALSKLAAESRRDSQERRLLKREIADKLAPLSQHISQIDQQIKSLKQQYATISQAWQNKMQAAYFASCIGTEPAVTFDEIYQRAATKLLYYANIHQLTPVGLAEFWWGPDNETHRCGQFYDASPAECQTLMHASKLAHPLPDQTIPNEPLSICYQDEFIIVVDKPAGLLSVPGRRYFLQDSVINRLRWQSPQRSFLQAVHRLDQATSGLIVVACSAEAHRILAQQFAKGKVHKTYEAVLSYPICKASGTINLPLWSNPDSRPKQSVDFEKGKLSRTDFKLIAPGDRPRVAFYPRTGRTHQLRVHAAHSRGLDSPILGDSLYGKEEQTVRLHLHAIALTFIHPITKETLHLKSKVPF